MVNIQKVRFGKKGVSHIDWAISMGIFITGLLALFILWQPWSHHDDWEGDFLTHIVMDNFLYGMEKADVTKPDMLGHPICENPEEWHCIHAVFYRKRLLIDLGGETNTYKVSLNDFGCPSCSIGYVLVKDQSGKRIEYNIDSGVLYVKAIGTSATPPIRYYYEVFFDPLGKNLIRDPSIIDTSLTTPAKECDYANRQGCRIGAGPIEFRGVTMENLLTAIYGIKSSYDIIRQKIGFIENLPSFLNDLNTQRDYTKIKQEWSYPSGRDFQICLRDNWGNIYQPSYDSSAKKLNLINTGITGKCKAVNSITGTEPPKGKEVYIFDMPVKLIDKDPSYDDLGYVKVKDSTGTRDVKMGTIFISVAAW